MLSRLQPGALVEALAKQAEEAEQAADSVQARPLLAHALVAHGTAGCSVPDFLGSAWPPCVGMAAALHVGLDIPEAALSWEPTQAATSHMGKTDRCCAYAGHLCARGAEQ